MTKLSIITVNLNNKVGLEKTINSVLSQTFTDFEWIIIDGGSTDGSKELIEKVSSRLTYWISEPDKGIYNAMNKGVQHSAGEYVQFLNSGDWLSSNTVLEEVFSNNFSEEIIYCNIAFYKNSFLERIQTFPKSMSVDFLLKSALGHNSCFVKSERLLRNCFDENLRIVSDWKFFLKAALDKVSFKYIEKCVGCFDMNGISETMPDLKENERGCVIEELHVEILEYKMRQTGYLRSCLSNLYLDEFIDICQNHKIAKKALTAIVLFMKRL